MWKGETEEWVKRCEKTSLAMTGFEYRRGSQIKGNEPSPDAGKGKKTDFPP